MADQGHERIRPAPGKPGTPGAASTHQPRWMLARRELEHPDVLSPDGPAADAWYTGQEPNTLASDAEQKPCRDGVREAARLRVQARQQLREFLRAVPRSEEVATLALIRPDGTTRLLTRAQLSAAIDRLRPRQRQIVRLAIEERWSRQRVCEYLHRISIKTFERDQIEALDLLAQL